MAVVQVNSAPIIAAVATVIGKCRLQFILRPSAIPYSLVAAAFLVGPRPTRHRGGDWFCFGEVVRHFTKGQRIVAPLGGRVQSVPEGARDWMERISFVADPNIAALACFYCATRLVVAAGKRPGARRHAVFVKADLGGEHAYIDRLKASVHRAGVSL